MSRQRISVIGAGLAGCSAALAAADRGARVDLYEQRPATTPPTHQSARPAELTGTADLGVEDLDRATGMLKAELRALCPMLMDCADSSRIGQNTLSVDRAAFASAVADRVAASGQIDLRREQVRRLPGGTVVVASGPGTWSPLARAIHAASGARLRFSFIGRPPLIAVESIDLSQAVTAPPYPGAEPATFVPLTEDEAAELTSRLASATPDDPPGFGEETVLAEESSTAERLARDPDGGLRRVLSGPRGPGVEDISPALRLTSDDDTSSAFHVDGLLTTLSPQAQLEVLRAIDAFAQARLVRPAMVQRTPWLAGADATLANLQLRRTQRVFLAGTLTGVYGYAEAMALGAVAGINAARLAGGPEPLPPPRECLSGALCWALTDREPQSDCRMLRANFGMIPEHRQDTGLSKSERRANQSERALEAIQRYAQAD
jgi:methylenetetrahydrofolate--tRNA-(uracil-5-)-methyltransferase